MAQSAPAVYRVDGGQDKTTKVTTTKTQNQQHGQNWQTSPFLDAKVRFGWRAPGFLLVHSHRPVQNCNTFQGVTICKSQPGVKVGMKLQPGRDLVVQLDSQLLSIFFFCTFTEARNFLVSLHLIWKLTGFVIRSGPAALRGHHQKPNHCDQTD